MQMYRAQISLTLLFLYLPPQLFLEVTSIYSVFQALFLCIDINMCVHKVFFYVSRIIIYILSNNFIFMLFSMSWKTVLINIYRSTTFLFKLDSFVRMQFKQCLYFFQTSFGSSVTIFVLFLHTAFSNILVFIRMNCKDVSISLSVSSLNKV